MTRTAVTRTLKLLALLALLAANAVLTPGEATARRADKYCTKDGPLWDCTDQCPPLGCNCDCSMNCVGAAF